MAVWARDVYDGRECGAYEEGCGEWGGGGEEGGGEGFGAVKVEGLRGREGGGGGNIDS